MRLANVSGRLCLVTEAGHVDVAAASAGRFTPDPQAVFERWAEFRQWARSIPAGEPPASVTGPSAPSAAGLGAPVPRPAQVFGIGLNYADHAIEADLELPTEPLVFAKFPSCVSGPADPLRVESDAVDWEVELVVVMGTRCRSVSPDRAWDTVAGLTLGQDVSDRARQWKGATPQFSLGKSGPGFAPIGPVLVTPDELDDPADLAIECRLNGTVVQSSRTSQLIFDVPALVAYLSAHVTLLPGDLIFTGTPAGVGATRTPPRYLRPGDELVSAVEGIGQIVTRVVAAELAPDPAAREVVA